MLGYGPVMPKVTGKEFQGVLEGGAAAAGGYIWLKVAFGGRTEVLLVEQSKVGALMGAIATSAAMAADERQRQGILEPNSALALQIDAVEPARSETLAGHAILDISIDAMRDTPWRLYLSADRERLEGMRAACDRALQMLREKARTN